MRDHGGDLDQAMARHGGPAEDWIDLSTGINRQPYPLARLPDAAFRRLPTRAEITALEHGARLAWGVPEAAGSQTLALAGAQAAIQAIPRLDPPGEARVLVPTYNEYRAALESAGWQAREVGRIEDLAGARLAVLANPNNPDGRRHAPGRLRELAGEVGRLLVDESFADADPELSLLTETLPGNLLVARSFGKFHGLAGVRLGFVTGAPADIGALRAIAGPWPVSGPAIAIGRAALADPAWTEATRARLNAEIPRLDALAQAAHWRLAGGTALFRLYETPDATAARDWLARSRIWSRIFPWSPLFLRLGMPGDEREWNRLSRALLSAPAISGGGSPARGVS